jgi:hypothetical protein
MGFAFGAFSVVVGPGGRAALQRRKPRQIENLQEPPVIAPGTVVVARLRYRTIEELLKGRSQGAAEKLRPDRGVMFVVVCEPNIA